MSSFESDIRQAKEHLRQGRLDASAEVLSRIHASTRSHSRELAHVRGILLMRQGEYQRAIDLFLNASSQYGHHVLLLIDLAACYYLTGQKQSWLRILDLAEYEFKNANSEISLPTQFTFQLTLGKMREEQGALSEAMSIYELMLEQLRAQGLVKFEAEKYLKALAQILRLKSQYGLSAQVSAPYRELIHHSADETNWDTAFEIEHALLIFETREFGADAGELRLAKLFKNPLLETREAALVLADFIFELLLLGRPVPDSLCERLAALGDLSPYAKTIVDFAQNKVPAPKDILDWPEAMSPGENLRLLSLCMKRKLDEMAEKRFLFLIRDFGEKTTKLWLSLTETEKLLSESSFQYDPAKKCLSLADLVLNLKAKTAHQELIELLIEKGPISPEKAIELLWNGEGFETDLSRLRMRIRRLNAEIEKIFGRGDFMTMTSREITFAYPVVIAR